MRRITLFSCVGMLVLVGFLWAQPAAEKQKLAPDIESLTVAKVAVRLAAVKKIGNLGLAGRSAARPLGERLDDPDEKVADAAARALAQIGPDGVPELIKGARSQKATVRYRSVWALGLMGPDAKEAVSTLADALKDDKPHIRVAAEYALGELEGAAKPAIPALCYMLKDKNAKARTQAALALSYIGGPAIEPIQELLADEDPEARLGAMEAISLIGPDAKDTVESLTKLLRDDSANQRMAAAFALGCIGPEAKEAITPLTSIMRDKNGEVQKRAFQALLNVGSGDVPGFLDTMRKLNADAHWAFPYILKQFGPKAKDAVKPLIKQLDAVDDGQRMSAALALAEIGKDARDAVPALQKALKDKSPMVRHSAGFALTRIMGEVADAAKQLPAVLDQVDNDVQRVLLNLPQGARRPVDVQLMFDPQFQAPYNKIVDLHVMFSAQRNQQGAAALAPIISKFPPEAVPALVRGINMGLAYQLGFC